MSVTWQTSAKQVITWYRDHYGKLSCRTALRVLHSIRGDDLTDQAHQFTLLPSYAEHLLKVDPMATVKLKKIGNRFSSLYVAPSASSHAWPNLRPFIAVDAAWTKVIHDYVLLIATGLDGNNEGINLAWGIAPKENMDHWGWFFDNMMLTLPLLNRPSTVIMSDRQKGLN